MKYEDKVIKLLKCIKLNSSEGGSYLDGIRIIYKEAANKTRITCYMDPKKVENDNLYGEIQGSEVICVPIKDIVYITPIKNMIMGIEYWDEEKYKKAWEKT
jgi:hypothetical protein